MLSVTRGPEGPTGERMLVQHAGQRQQLVTLPTRLVRRSFTSPFSGR